MYPVNKYSLDDDFLIKLFRSESRKWVNDDGLSRTLVVEVSMDRVDACKDDHDDDLDVELDWWESCGSNVVYME